MITWLVEVNKDHGDCSPAKAIRSSLIQWSLAPGRPHGDCFVWWKLYSHHIITKGSQALLLYEIGCISGPDQASSLAWGSFPSSASWGVGELLNQFCLGEATHWGVRKDTADTRQKLEYKYLIPLATYLLSHSLSVWPLRAMWLNM